MSKSMEEFAHEAAMAILPLALKIGGGTVQEYAEFYSLAFKEAYKGVKEGIDQFKTDSQRKFEAEDSIARSLAAKSWPENQWSRS